jgi:hypothetical protein
MTRRKSQGGSTSVTALILLVLLAAVAGGGIIVLQSALSYDAKSVRNDEQKLPLKKEAQRVIKALCDDTTPEADSPLDQVWSAIRMPETEGVTIKLQDLSSNLNPNWVQKNILAKTHLGDLLKPGVTPDVLQQRREDKGFSVDLALEYGDLIKEEAIPKYFTAYSYANINVTDEFALRKLYAIRTGDEPGSEVFHGHVQELLAQKKILKPTDLRQFLGIDYDTLYPMMNVEPIINVHFMDPMVLNELLSYPDWKVSHPREKAQIVLDSRDRSELTGEELRRIIGVAEDNRILQYLGVITWFWKITVSRETASLVLIVARLPSEGESAPRFLITEERFSP